ncbi:hypothetical protein KIN20_036631 [Parelaphostrongylus tenuis]|uniref:Uncharacterized protein n=1 Tax=Parelaphostrongylus tenuis TaxID=148309 RepID=A0AAD5RDE6_PARTN|nr:hypothetical protein KIN20_036631 [Parelaphostrongylus tenuis]
MLHKVQLDSFKLIFLGYQYLIVLYFAFFSKIIDSEINLYYPHVCTVHCKLFHSGSKKLRKKLKAHVEEEKQPSRRSRIFCLHPKRKQLYVLRLHNMFTYVCFLLERSIQE